MRYIFFGSGHFAEPILQNLKEIDFLPTHIVTAPDRPVGRHQVLTPPQAKVFADQHNIPTFQPESLKTEDTLEKLKQLIAEIDAVVVADYGKIIPQNILDLSPTGFLNIHPSLLPEYRGPTPVQSTILNNNPHTGVTIIKMDKLMDHGPIVIQKAYDIDEHMWPCPASLLYTLLAPVAAEMLKDILPKYVLNEIPLTEQDHEKATYVKLIDKANSQVDINDAVENIYLKYQAYEDWPGIFFINEGKRVKIKKMSRTEILRVTPEGKNEMDFAEYLKHHPLP